MEYFNFVGAIGYGCLGMSVGGIGGTVVSEWLYRNKLGKDRAAFITTAVPTLVLGVVGMVLGGIYDLPHNFAGLKEW